MRVIAGRLGGRNFASPRGHRTHPMSDKVRGALFNALGDIEGLSVLDAFAGSGALGYEAVSRGAAQVLAIDTDSNAQQAIAANITSLGLANNMKLIKASAAAWLSTSDETFDIVLCDPPYDDPQLKLLGRLAERVKPNGLAVFSLPPGIKPGLPAHYELLAAKSYGDARLLFYRRVL
ncbi:MAG TPA: RsmD family RNA methyltransferase [Candidatus Saccharimonadales bacterium]